MLNSLRNASKSWFIKILLGLLILSFGIWGIGDIVWNRTKVQPAAVVGKLSISIQEISNELQRSIEQISYTLGEKVTTEQALKFGLLQHTLDQMITRALFNQDVKNLELDVSEDNMRQIISEISAFQNESGVFDKNIYKYILNHSGLTERQFITAEKNNIMRKQIIKMISSGLNVPDLMFNPLYSYHQEKRIAETITFLTDKVPEPAKPNDTILNQYHKDHTHLFMLPEMRGITAIAIRATDVADNIKFTDADVEKAYKIRHKEFQTTETRNVQQALFNDATKAKEFANMVLATKQISNFNNVARTAGAKVSDLGWVDRNSMSLPILADATFENNSLGVIGPIETSFGWHVLRINQVIPSKPRPISDVKNQIIQDLTNDETTNRLYALSTKIEDAIGSGASIDEVANTFNLKPIKIAAVDEHGFDSNDNLITDIPKIPSFLTKAFQTPQGTTTEVIRFDDSNDYFILHVDSVTPPTIKPFDQIKDRVIDSWVQEQKKRVTYEKATAVIERLKNGELLTVVANPLKPETTQPFYRHTDKEVAVSPLIVTEMFKNHLKIGDASIIKTQDGTTVARLKEIIVADPATQDDNFRNQLNKTLSQDILQQYIIALHKNIGVSVNNDVIEKHFKK
ncbi:MAG: SurA N-terminal domain-containing protein [Rhodospirillaceae bacterium]|jgi:peptidyl-prolyl cis-trans isomerase D|nr:SurA N-terminal domain-containing protein [Rhodospirillaceae bacterium]